MERSGGISLQSLLNSFLSVSSLGCILVCLIYNASNVNATGQKLRKDARAYSSPSSSSNSLSSSVYDSSSSSNYQDNFDSMFDSMDINKNGNQKVKIALPNPPMPPKPPRPMAAPNMGNYENDPNRMPNMPRPPAPPNGFGPMDIEFQFPSYEPSVDDSFFDSDATNSLSSGVYGSSGSSSSNSGSGGYGSSSGSGSGSSGSGSGSSYGSLTGTSCSPRTQPSVTNGVCVAESQIGTKCRNLQLAMSSNCQSQQFCCFANVPGSNGSSSSSSSSGVTSAPGTGGSSTTYSSSNYNSNTGATTSRPVSGPVTSPMSGGGGGGGGSGSTGATGSSGVTLAPAAGSVSCSPLSNPAITNGLCYNTNQLQANCRGMQMSKSNQCQYGQFCCFTAPGSGNAMTTNAPGGGGGVPSPASSTASAVTGSMGPGGIGGSPSSSTSTSTTRPGNMTPAPTMATQSMSMSTSTTSTSTVRPTSPPTMAMSSSTSTTRAPSSSSVTAPSSTMAPATMATPVAGMTTTYSYNYASSTGGANRLSVDGHTSCQPVNRVGITGKCVLKSQLASECRALSISKQANGCAGGEFCCFSEAFNVENPSPADKLAAAAMAAMAVQASSSAMSSGKSCHPNSNPSAHGECVTTSLLSTQCKNRAASKSQDCAVREWCCIASDGASSSDGQQQQQQQASSNNEKPVVSISLLSPSDQNGGATNNNNNNNGVKVAVSVEPAANQETSVASNNNVNPPTSQQQTCSPNENPSIHNGICLTMRQLSVQCVDKKASVSHDCSFGRFCCYEENGGSSGSSDNNAASESASSQANANGQQTSNKVEVNVQPGAAGSGQVVISVGSQSAANGNQASAGGQTTAANENNQQQQQQPAQVVIGVNPNAAAVNPPQSQLTVSVAQQSSSSSNNNNNNPVSVIVASVQMPVKTCSPNSNQNVKDGHCMTIRELRASCVDQKASPSSDCDMGSWCCFMDHDEKIATEAPTPVAAVVVEQSQQQQPAAVVIQVQQQPSPQTEAPAVVVAPDNTASEQQCTPNSKPDINDGICMPTRDLRVRCKNQRVSKSPNCRLGHWCCFVDNSNPVQLSVNELGRAINAL